MGVITDQEKLLVDNSSYYNYYGLIPTTTINNNNHLSNRKRKLIFINSNISKIAGTLPTTALTTDFNISVNTAQWLTSGFNLTMAIIIHLTSYLLVDSVGWRMIFVLSIAIMAITFIYTIFVFEDVIENHKVHLNIISFILSGITFGGVTLAIGNFGSHKFVNYQVLMVLLIGFIAGILFTYHQLHINIPFLDLHVFQHKDFTIAIIITAIIQLILMGSAVIFPLLFQDVMGRTSTISGLAVLPGSLALSVVIPFAGKIYDKFVSINIWVVIVINIVRCVAVGVLTMSVITWGIRQVPDTKTAYGSATLNSFRILRMGIGSALFVSIMTIVRDSVKDSKETELFGINVDFLSVAILILKFHQFKRKEKLFKEADDIEEKIIEVVINDLKNQKEK
ncbi:major facilitator superfamily domain-containing protein [Neocallimastix sp. 'constans']